MITQLDINTIDKNDMNKSSDDIIEKLYSIITHRNILTKMQCQIGMLSGMNQINNYINKWLTYDYRNQKS